MQRVAQLNAGRHCAALPLEVLEIFCILTWVDCSTAMHAWLANTGCVVDCRKFLLLHWRLDLTSREQPYAQMLVSLYLEMFKVGECQRHCIVYSLL